MLVSPKILIFYTFNFPIIKPVFASRARFRVLYPVFPLIPAFVAKQFSPRIIIVIIRELRAAL